MNSFVVFWGLLIIISIIIGLIYFAYWLPKRLGKRKLGLWFSGILAAVVLTFIIGQFFEDKFFYKSDAREKLKEYNIELRDNFEIVSNESGGFTDYFHQFTLKITLKDKDRLIEQVTCANNYKGELDEMSSPLSKIRYSETDTIFTANYQDKWNYTFEFYKPNKKGYAPTWDKISISKGENQLTYQRLID